MIPDDLWRLSLGALLLVPGAWVWLKNRDAWPYSSYPMFSAPLTVAAVRVYRVALVLENGEQVLWKPRFAKLQETFGNRCARLLRDGKTPSEAEEQRLRADLVHYIAAEPLPSPRPVAVIIVERRIKDGSTSSEIEEREARRFDWAEPARHVT